jgi:type I restriction enzyme S subunit
MTFEQVPLGRLIEVRHGFAFKSEHFVDHLTQDVLVTPGNFAIGGGFQLSKPKHYEGPVPNGFVFEAGDLIVTMTDLSKAGDTLGYAAAVPSSDQVRFLHNQRVGRVVVTADELIDSRFLYFALRTNAYRQQILATATGSTVRHTSPSRILAASIPLPSLPEQRRIVSVLEVLEEAQHQTSVIARRAEELLAVQYRLLIDIERTEPKPLGSVVEVVMGQSPPGATYGDESTGILPLVQGMGAFGERFPVTEIWTSAPTKEAREGDVLLTVRAPVGEINICNRAYCAGRGVAALRSETPAYTEQLARSLRRRWAAQESGTIFPAVNKTQIENLVVLVPSSEAVAQFEAATRPLYDLIRQQYEQGVRLKQTQAELLPKLVSGRVRVSDAYTADAASNADGWRASEGAAVA